MQFLWSSTSIHNVTSLFSFSISSKATEMMGCWSMYSSILYPSYFPINTVGMVTKCPFPSSLMTTSCEFSTILSIITANLPPSFCTLIDFCVKVQSALSTIMMFFFAFSGISSQMQSYRNSGVPIQPEMTFPYGMIPQLAIEQGMLPSGYLSAKQEASSEGDWTIILAVSCTTIITTTAYFPLLSIYQYLRLRLINIMSSAIPKTRHGGRNKRFSAAVRKVDENKRKAVIEEKLRYLQEDFFEDPNKMAELDDDDGFEVGEGEPRKHKNEKRVNKRAKKEGHLKRNLNLRKIIQEEGLEEKTEPNFCNIKVGRPRYPSRKYCSICGNLSRSSCPRCGERICQLKCFRIHSEIKCLNFQIQY